MRLQNKVAIITGAARGIGAAFAEAYVREGAYVVIADIDIQRAEETAKRIGPHASAGALDVTNQISIDACVAEVEKRHGGIDILINNAAAFIKKPFEKTTRKDFEKMNLKIVYF